MRREFLLQVGFVVLVNLLIKPFYIFGIDRTIQNVVAAEQYGLFFAAFNFTYLFQILNDFGLQAFHNGQVARSGRIVGGDLVNLIRVKFLLGLVYLLLVFVVAQLLDYPSDYLMWIGMLALNHGLNSWVLFFRSGISGMGYYFRDSLLSVMDKLLLILIAGLLLWGDLGQGPFQMVWLIWAQGLSLLLTSIVAGILVFRLSGSLSAPFNWHGVRQVLVESLPYALVVFLMTAYTRIDAVMLERMLAEGAVEAGRYAAGFRLLDAVNMLGFLFAGLLLPMFSRLLASGERPDELAATGFRVLVSGAVILAAAVSVYSQPIMAGLYVDGDGYSAQLLTALIWSFPFFSGSYIYGTLLTAHRSLRAMNAVFVWGVLLNVGLNLWWIPSHKAVGAAWVTTLTQGLMFVAQYLLAHRLLRMPYDIRILLRLGMLAGLVVGLGWLLEESSWFFWELRFFLLLGMGLIFTFVLGLIKPELLLGLLRSRSHATD